MNPMYCYLNGNIIDVEQARVSVNDIGMLRGYGVFDVLRTYGQKPFLLEQHFARLERSTAALHLHLPLDEKQFSDAVVDLLGRNHYGKEAVIRVVVTGGEMVNGMAFKPQSPTFFILIEPFVPLSQSLYERGAALITHEHQRELPTIKTINYITAITLQKRKIEQGALEILFTSHGNALEASTSNVFMFTGNKLITPKDNILVGITRNFVVQLARGQYVVEERAVSLHELLSADEVFITATNKDIVPIVSIDKQYISTASVGTHTKKLMELFRHASEIS